ncbi:sporulation protein YunB [Bacillus sp. CGMCC 1.16607]|uniref:sporulation protein YunB n=1 Tax=Bacillus sp. CGMCC 1.16607 TaxID=3351842 RepID=UPI00363B0C6E
MAKFRRLLPRKGPLPFRYVFLLTFVFFTFSTASGLWVINKGIEPTLMAYAESQTKKIATVVINQAINKKIATGMKINDIIELTPSDDGGTAANLNTEIITSVIADTHTLVSKNLKEASKGNLELIEQNTDVAIDYGESKKAKGIVYEIPIGQATNNALLGNLGPKIPISFHAVGEVEVNPKTELKPFGINNVWIAIYIEVKVDVQIIVPFSTKITSVTQDIPLAMGTIPGKVPQYYNGGGGDGTSIELPLN